MKITFHGAARTVTGSKHLITLSNGKSLLLDCGLFQGLGPETDDLNRNFGFDPSSVNYMILSHAHVDHCGLIPKLIKDGYKGKIFCTAGTYDLSAVLMEDSASIQEGDLKMVNKRRSLRHEQLISPLYTTADAIAATSSLVVVDYKTWHRIDDDIEFQFTDAGHIVGSTTVHLRIKENGKLFKITFSGDVGRYRDVILKSPEPFEQADYIIMESTYGNSLHEDVAQSPDILLDWIERTCIQKKGKLIIPAFSVGRTQEILFSLNQLEIENRLPQLEYFVDSPLSSKATEIVKKYPEYFNSRIQKILQKDEDPFNFKGLKFTKSVEDSKLLNYYNKPCVIISASGMAEAGRVKHHISNNIEDSRCAILMTGYCEPNSLGARLLKHPGEVTIYGQIHQVNAEIGQMKSMSAHGDYEDLLQWLSCQDPTQIKKLFLVHGEYEVQEAFRDRLMKKKFEVYIPKLHEEVGLW